MKTKKVIKYHVKKEVKSVLKGIVVAVVALAIVISTSSGINGKDEEAMNYCMQKNNNYNYCINGIKG